MSDITIKGISPYDIDIESIDNDTAIEIYEKLDSGEINWPSAIGLSEHVSDIQEFVDFVLDNRLILNIRSLFKGSLDKAKSDWERLTFDLSSISNPKSRFHLMSGGFDNEGYEKCLMKRAPDLKNKLKKTAKLLVKFSSFYQDKRPYYILGYILIDLKNDIKESSAIIENKIEDYSRNLNIEKIQILKSIASEDDLTVLDLIMRLELILNNIELLLKAKSLNDEQSDSLNLFFDLNELEELELQYDAFKVLCKNLYNLNFEKHR